MKPTKTITAVLAFALAAGFAATSWAQQAVVQQQQPPRVAPQPQQVQPQATRSYRSYSVSPSTEPQYSQGHTGHATWRHGDSKARGHYHSGR